MLSIQPWHNASCTESSYDMHRSPVCLFGNTTHTSLFDRNIQSQILLDAGRTAALKQRLLTADPNFDFALVSDLGSPTSRGLSIESDVRTGNCVMLVESRHAVARLPLHVLLLRSDGD